MKERSLLQPWNDPSMVSGQPGPPLALPLKAGWPLGVGPVCWSRCGLHVCSERECPLSCTPRTWSLSGCYQMSTLKSFKIQSPGLPCGPGFWGGAWGWTLLRQKGARETSRGQGKGVEGLQRELGAEHTGGPRKAPSQSTDCQRCI